MKTTKPPLGIAIHNGGAVCNFHCALFDECYICYTLRALGPTQLKTQLKLEFISRNIVQEKSKIESNTLLYDCMFIQTGSVWSANSSMCLAFYDVFFLLFVFFLSRNPI